MSEQHHNEEVEYFYIKNEEGIEEKFEILYEFNNPENGYNYLLLLPGDAPEEDVEVDVYPVRYKEVAEGEEPTYEILETEEEFEMVEEVLRSLEEDDLFEDEGTE